MATCERITSSTCSSGYVAAVRLRRAEHFFQVREIFRHHTLYIEIVPLVGDLWLGLHHQVPQQHLVVTLAPIVRAGGRATFPAFETADDSLGLCRLCQFDRLEQ